MSLPGRLLKRTTTALRRIADRPHTAAAAEKEIRALLRNPGLRRPGPDIVRRARDYAADALGDWQYYPELLIYATYRGTFVEGWIPNTFFGRVLPLLNQEYYATGRARTLAARILDTDLLPDLALCVDGRWYDPAGRPIPANELRDRLFAHGDRVVVKTDGSRAGQGIQAVTLEAYDREGMPPLDCAVAQRAIVQCALFDRIQPNSVCTLRVLTTRAAGAAPRMVASFLRVGRSDMAFVGAGAIRVPVLDRDGRLGAFGSDYGWLRHAAHPDTGFRFEGVVIDGHRAAIEACEALHARVPQFGIVGWDVTINAEGRCELMEWNTRHPSVLFPEATFGPLFADLRLGEMMRRARDPEPAARPAPAAAGSGAWRPEAEEA